MSTGDSMGNKEQVPAGEFQIMSAGTGVRHSEYNPSSTDRLRLYQIWIIPEETGITPRYEQRRFDAAQGKQLVLSPDAREGSLKVHQDMELYRWALLKDEQSVHQIAAERRVWIRVVKGEVTINGTKATTSDGLAIWDEQAISVHADSDSEILLFDLPPVLIRVILQAAFFCWLSSLTPGAYPLYASGDSLRCRLNAT